MQEYVRHKYLLSNLRKDSIICFLIFIHMLSSSVLAKN